MSTVIQAVTTGLLLGFDIGVVTYDIVLIVRYFA